MAEVVNTPLPGFKANPIGNWVQVQSYSEPQNYYNIYGNQYYFYDNEYKYNLDLPPKKRSNY